MKLTTDKKLKLSSWTIFILLFLTLIYSVVSLKYSVSTLKDIISKNQLIQLNLIRYASSLKKEISFVKDVIIVGTSESFLNAKLKNYSEAKDEVKKDILDLQKNIKDANISADLKQVMNNIPSATEQINRILEKTITIYKIKGQEKASNYFYSNNINDLYSEMLNISNLNQKYYENKFYKLIRQKQTTILIIAIIFVIVIIVAFVLINTVAQKFIKNIKYLILSAEQVSLGMLDTPIKSQTNDDLQDIAKIFDYLRIHIKKNMEKLKNIN